MIPFLKEVAEEIILKYNDFKDLILILPGKRSGVFLKNELLKINSHTSYAPEIYSIEQFVEKLASLRSTENTQLLFELYEVYKQETPPEELESFKDFSKWGQIIIQDFNEIDRHLVDHKKIFAYLSSIKEMNHWYLQEQKTELQKNYIRFWNTLGTYYIQYRERLLKKRTGYQGLIYKEAFNNAATYLAENLGKHHIFIGFNALSRAGEEIIQQFLMYPDNTIFWDIDETFLTDRDHDAGLFIRSYKKKWNYFKNNDFKYASNTFKAKKDIQIIGVPRAVGQAKYVGKIIRDIHKNTNNLDNTAVILGNETLLTPVLNALPDQIEQVNITCGFPLYQTPVTSFFNAFFQLAESRKKNTTWYYKSVLNILAHSLSRKLLHEKKDYARAITLAIQQKNMINVSLNDIKALLPESLHQLTDHIFIDTKLTVNAVIEKCRALIYLLKEAYDENAVYQEYLYKFYEIFNRILLLNTRYQTISDIASLKSIYNEFLRQETVNFKGDPLQGLQIMGMLESRNLDFENVIITSVNEGILPSGKKRNSFLPFELKIAFQLPAYKEKDAVYTYHFYRLLQRAKNIYLLYNTEPNVLEGSEKSRFLLQLTTQRMPGHTIKEVIATPKVSYLPKKTLEIKKNADVLKRLKKIAEQGFSPTSLSNYIRNPIDFYHNTILKVKPEEELEETITARILGIIIHNTLEELYKPYEGKLLHEAAVLKMKKEMNAVISRSFMQIYREEHFSKGKNLISLAIVKRYIQHFLTIEATRLKHGKTIKILHVEKSLTTKINIPELRMEVALQGMIDRVEEVDGVVTIVDYKTGKVIPSDIEITDESAMIEDYKYHKAFQLLSYALLYTKNYTTDKPVEAAILSFKNLKIGYLKFSKKEKLSKSAGKITTIDRELLTAYENTFKSLILEMFNADIPFTAKEIHEKNF